jgi:hypothetical protein
VSHDTKAKESPWCGQCGQLGNVDRVGRFHRKVAPPPELTGGWEQLITKTRLRFRNSIESAPDYFTVYCSAKPNRKATQLIILIASMKHAAGSTDVSSDQNKSHRSQAGSPSYFVGGRRLLAESSRGSAPWCPAPASSGGPLSLRGNLHLTSTLPFFNLFHTPSFRHLICPPPSHPNSLLFFNFPSLFPAINPRLSKMDSLSVPRKLWEHPNPESTEMYRLMQEINAKHNLQLNVRQILLPSSLLQFTN